MPGTWISVTKSTRPPQLFLNLSRGILRLAHDGARLLSGRREQDDAAYERRKFRHKAHYSLNREDGIENDALNRPLTPEEVLEQKLLREEVYAALMQLTAIQARRIYARFYLGMTVAEIARIEGADRRRVWESIRRGLKKLARLLDTAQ